MSRLSSTAVIGLRSSARMSAKRIHGEPARVKVFGRKRIPIKPPRQDADMRQAFVAAGVAVLQEAPDATGQGKAGA